MFLLLPSFSAQDETGIEITQIRFMMEIWWGESEARFGVKYDSNHASFREKVNCHIYFKL